ncbi:trans-sialidase, putative, partial [Trypanosoma cruzi]
MLSRVAAVEAPRTHSRRGVTGSSGRRREGESEPQRPNMSRHLFYSAVLLLVVMVCCGTGGASAEQPSKKKFKWKDVITEGVTLESLGAPGLLKVGNDVFAVAEAQCKKNGVGFTGVASQPLTPQTADTPEELFSDALKKTRVLEEDVSDDAKNKVDVSRPTTVLKGSDIYMLVGVYNKVTASGEGDAGGCVLLLVKGSVSGGEGTNNKIEWKDTEGSPQIVDAQSDSWTRLIGSGGSGVKMHDETLLFPVEGTKKVDGTGRGCEDCLTGHILLG